MSDQSSMTIVDHVFLQRVSSIPSHGLGLSVDVYSPDLFDLLEALKHRGLTYGYLEIFKASQPALVEVRRRLPGVLLEYHAEGLWVTQPRLEQMYPFQAEFTSMTEHARTLDAYWINHECATKQMAGYSFGTYLPPLFTHLSADVTAEQAELVQDCLDRQCAGSRSPLLLLEVPPLTYFRFGDLSVPEFFHRIVEQAPCGLVLDIGHLWTIYRYSAEGRRQGLEKFLDEFLDAFPLERVVQIHVAGLAVHASNCAHASEVPRRNDFFPSQPPLWIDAHSAPIPDVLFDVLVQTLSHSKLIHLKGVALEVDTKPVLQIVTEFERFRKQFGWWERRVVSERPKGQSVSSALPPKDRNRKGEGELLRQYDVYAQVVTGRFEAALPTEFSSELEPKALEIYRWQYLPHEILEWGGNLRDMFPDACRHLDGSGIPLSAFIEYWFQEPRPIHHPYDFFLIKVERFTAFIREVMPEAGDTVAREADELRQAYEAACKQVGRESLHGNR